MESSLGLRTLEEFEGLVRFTFPSDYKFHYPELSAMFDIPEEDTYKFCLLAAPLFRGSEALRHAYAHGR